MLSPLANTMQSCLSMPTPSVNGTLPVLRRRLAIWLLGLVALAAALAGCSDKAAEAPWLAYQTQLADDLDAVAIEPGAPDNIGAFPARDERLINVAETRTSLLNVYALRECQITSLVAAHNNQLGRVAPPSQQWLYERELWQRLTLCWQGDTPDDLADEDRTRLKQLLERKTAQLPAVGWNALFDSEEWVGSFSRASQPLAPGDISELEPQLQAVGYLQQMVDGQFSVSQTQDSATLEGHLKALRQRPLSAEVLRTLLLAEQRLREANQQLMTDPTHCLQAWDDAWLLDLMQAAHTWLTAVNRLIDSQMVTPPGAVQTYQREWLSLTTDNAPWQRLQATLARHRELRRRFAICGDA